MTNLDQAADDLFRRDAERLGYLGPDGQGMAAYMRDHGMLTIGYFDFPREEMTGFMDFLDAEGCYDDVQ
jgi:hypothetical protein